MGFGHAGLGPRQLACIAVDEVVHRLLSTETTHRGKHAESVGSEEDHILGMRPDRGNFRPGNITHRIGDASVFRFGSVVIVRHSAVGVEDHVFEYGAESDGIPDLGFAFPAELDAFGIAATLDVEHAGVRPSVFVIADEGAIRIGRERGLARTGKPKEQGDVGFVIFIHVCRAVHGKHAHLGQVVVHSVEDRLLDLPRIARADDDDFSLFQ